MTMQPAEKRCGVCYVELSVVQYIVKDTRTGADGRYDTITRLKVLYLLQMVCG